MSDSPSERPNEIFRQLSSMSAEDLSTLMAYLVDVERDAAAQLSGEGTLSAGPPELRGGTVQLSGEGTVTAAGVVDQLAITDELSVTLTHPNSPNAGTAHISVTVSGAGHSVPTGTGAARIHFTGSATGHSVTSTGTTGAVAGASSTTYVAPAAPEAVASIWNSIKPRSTEDAVRISRELRYLILFMLLIFGGSSGAIDTSELREALGDALRASLKILEEATSDDPEPGGE